MLGDQQSFPRKGSSQSVPGFLESLKKRGKNELLVCPVCFSSRVELFLGGCAGNMYRCLDCGYIGSIVLLMTPEEYIRALERKRTDENR